MPLQEGEHFFARDTSAEDIRVCQYAIRVRACVACAYASAVCVSTCNIYRYSFLESCVWQYLMEWGVEAGDALLDEGPQSLPAMRL